MTTHSAEKLTLSQITGLVGYRFRVLLEAAEDIELELAQIVSKPELGANFECFSLVFKGPADRLLRQGTYRFEHRQLGGFDLFIVPVGQEPGACLYQADFNQLLPMV